MTDTLPEELASVIENLKAREWIQNAEERDGAVCAHGAVMTCQYLRPGDAQIIRAVMRAKGLTEGWNDAPGRTKEQVLQRLSTIHITDTDLADTFGPNWRQVVAVIRRAAVLTSDEATRMGAAWVAAGDDAWDAAGDDAWSAARAASMDAAWDAAWAAARAAAWDAAKAAAWDAARAAVVADLVGQHRLTQDHLDTLWGPWITVLGPDWIDAVNR